MKKSIGGVVGLALGAVLGNILGGPLLVVAAAGLGGLAGYYVGSGVELALARRRS